MPQSDTSAVTLDTQFPKSTAQINPHPPIEPSLDSLRNQLNRLARYLPAQAARASYYAAEHLQDIAFFTIRDFSERAGVSPASTLRMVRALGYKGYREFRESFQKILKSTPGAANLVLKDAQQTDALLTCYCALSRDDLPDFNSSLNAAADQITKANTVYVVGFRSAHAFAQYFSYHAHITMPKIRLASPAMASVTDHLANAGKKDLVIMFSMAPYSTQAVQLAQYLADQKIPTIAITDETTSPFAKRCSHVLATLRPKAGQIQSMAGCVIMSEALLSRCHEKMGLPAHLKTRAYENNVRKMHGYWPAD